MNQWETSEKSNTSNTSLLTAHPELLSFFWRAGHWTRLQTGLGLGCDGGRREKPFPTSSFGVRKEFIGEQKARASVSLVMWLLMGAYKEVSYSFTVVEALNLFFGDRQPVS